MPNVAIFLNQVLPLSCIFIHHQTSALQRYKPLVLGCSAVSPSVDTGDAYQTIVLNRHGSAKEKLQTLLFKSTGYAPSLHQAAANTSLIHAHFGPTGWLAMPLATRNRLPLIVTLHGFDVLKREVTMKQDGLLQTIYTKQKDKLARATSRFICVSEYLKERAIAFGFPEEKCIVHYMGIPLKPHKEPKRERKEGEPVRLLAVGRLVAFKAHSKLIEAVSALEKAGHQVHLDIIGGGELETSLKQQAANSLKSYHFHGAQPHDYVLSMMRQSDIFCHTSMHQPNGQTESFGLVALEAQWAGLPVVAFASGGVPEAVKTGETGYLCEEGNVSELVSALSELLGHPEKIASMSSAAPAFVQQHFDNRIQTAKLEQIYDRCLNENRNF